MKTNLFVFTLTLAGVVCGQTPGFLKVKVLEGDGAFNDIKHKTGHAMSVEVRDENNVPVSGAEVTFSAPAFGPGGTFPGGGQAASARTNAEGVAQAEALKPNLTEGRFNIAVSAKLLGREGSAVIGQSNTTAGVVQGSSHKKAWIFVALAAGGGVGAAVALSGGKSSPTGGSAGSTATVLSTGGVIVGAPR